MSLCGLTQRTESIYVREPGFSDCGILGSLLWNPSLSKMLEPGFRS